MTVAPEFKLTTDQFFTTLLKKPDPVKPKSAWEHVESGQPVDYAIEHTNKTVRKRFVKRTQMRTLYRGIPVERAWLLLLC